MAVGMGVGEGVDVHTNPWRTKSKLARASHIITLAFSITAHGQPAYTPSEGMTILLCVRRNLRSCSHTVTQRAWTTKATAASLNTPVHHDACLAAYDDGSSGGDNKAT